jgi:GT2 family glycosyltransferase
VLRNTHPGFEVVVLDQSDNDATLDAVRPFQADSRVRYERSETQGLGAAHNAGIVACKGECILITDDDCDVPPDWVAKMASVFDDHPSAGMLFCRVDPAEYDPVAGHIPVFPCEEERFITGLADLRLGIGAGMAITRKAFEAAGGFDPATGPGGAFPSGEEADTAYRLLVKGFGIVLTNRTRVIHRGFRTWKQIALHTMRDVTGSGAVYAKLARHGHWRFGLHCARLLGKWGWESARNLARLRKPHGIRRSAWLIKGFRHGWFAPIDAQTLRFALTAEQASRYRQLFIQRDV